MFARDLPGPGDFERFPIMSPDDPRCDDDDDALEVIAAHIVDERMESAEWIDEAFSELEPDDYKRAAVAIAAGNPHHAGEILRDAVARIIKLGADKEARARLDRMRREDEADCYADRVTQ